MKFEWRKLFPISWYRWNKGHKSTKTVEKYYFHQSTRTLKTIKQVI